MKQLYPMLLVLLSSTLLAQDNRELLNLSYTSEAPDTLRQINLVLPAETSDSTPILLWIGGGAWAYVDRHQEMGICRKIANEGIVVASVGHRLSPQLLREPYREDGVSHPAHVKDVAKAFAWLAERADEYGFDINRMYVGGFSSGAHLSALLVADSTYLTAEGHHPRDVAGIIPVGGAFDVIHYRDILTEAVPEYLANHIHAVFGETDAQQINASPNTFLDHLDCRMLIISDSNTYKYNKYFEDQLKEHEYTNFDVLHVGQLSHGDLWRNLAAPNSMYRDLMVGFIRD